MINNKKIIAVITARAGSSLTGKNYRRFCDMPLIYWSVLAAQLSEYVDSVIVSTNCKEVEKVVKGGNGLSDKTIILNRPDALSTATSKNESALIHAYWWSSLKKDLTADIIINLQPTSPIRNRHLIDNCLESMVNGNHDSLLTVNKSTPFMWKSKDSKYSPMYDVLNRPMRQDVTDSEFLLYDNGCLYMMNSDILLDRMCRIGYNPYLFETTQYQSMQIDTEEDFIIMESVCKSALNNIPI